MRIYEITYRPTGRKTRNLATLTPDEAPRKLMKELIEELDLLERELIEIQRDVEYNKKMYDRSCIRVPRQPCAKMFYEKVKRRKKEQLYRESRLAELKNSRMRRKRKIITIEAALYRHLCRTEKNPVSLKPKDYFGRF